MNPCEVSWFSALCDDDYEYLGVPDPLLRSSWEHCRDIVMQADSQGFDDVLLPSGYALGIDTTAFAAAIATWVRRIRLLMAVRIGESWPPQLARQIATIDRMLGASAGQRRLTINIISSELPGETLASAPRYARTVEAMHILRTLLGGQPLDHDGEFWKLKLDPPRVGTVSGRCPQLYFGGLSEDARQAAAKGADVYLMWPDTLPTVREIIADLRERAGRAGRSLRFGYRVHVVVRETEEEARAAADRLLSRLDDEIGRAIRARSLDSQSAGVQRQAQLREASGNDGYVEDNLWTGIGRARSGCGAAIVGDPDQVLAKLQAYREAGIEAFILSGYPHMAEADLFARHVLPRLDHGPLRLIRSPAEIFGALFADVQERRLFGDSKTFADAVPRQDPQAILAAYEPGWDDAALRTFVTAHFELPVELEVSPPRRAPDLAAQIAALWSQLERPPVPADDGSLLAFAHRHVVPGGRFHELYYWDSYFTMLGLVADGHADLVEAMIDGFAALIERHGHIPNGIRSYYLSRSQPPVFHLMPGLLGHWKPAWRTALEREHRFWMDGERAVAMPDGAVLNRYWDDRDGPRDESWAEDVATGRHLGRELRAGAESGWDFSSRWLGDGTTLATIRTTRLIPCDLNALLFGMELELGLDDAAERRRAAMTRWLWHEGEGRFGDWDLDAHRINPGLTAATAAPLFTGVASPAQADRVAATIEQRLLAPGGLRTSLVATGQQWDAPNGWAPLQWFAVAGLRHYRRGALADTIAHRWLATVENAWRETGLLFEKYDVEQGGRGGGGEYEPQAGFGWTNGVTRAILNSIG